MLLLETHLAKKKHFQLKGCSFYGTNHPDGKAHGGTGILIRKLPTGHIYKYTTKYLQPTYTSRRILPPSLH